VDYGDKYAHNDIRNMPKLPPLKTSPRRAVDVLNPNRATTLRNDFTVSAATPLTSYDDAASRTPPVTRRPSFTSYRTLP
jgi:hypothetical protein